MKKGGKKFRGQPPRQRNGNGREIISHPPQIPSYGITRDVRMRFQSNAGFAANITFQNLLDTCLVASGAITGIDLFESVKINQVEVWAQGIIGTPVTAIVAFDGAVVGAQGDQKTHTDTSMGVEPAHVRARPGLMTQAGQFQASSANTAFFLECPANTVVDVSLSFRQPVMGGAIAAQNATVAAVAGTVYYRGLDGKAVAATVLPVVGALATI